VHFAVRDEITPLILTFNEAPNIGRALDKLTWAKRIVVVDSFSADETETICRRFPHVDFIQRKFESFADQCNFGLTLVRTPWVLSLDADYILSNELLAELGTLAGAGEVDGFRARFIYCVGGHPLRSTLYPPRTVLYRKDKARYRNEGHGHCVGISGNVRELKRAIFHDDRKPLDRWFDEQLKYSAQEARYLEETPVAQLNAADRLRRKIVFAPFAVLFYTLIVRGLILDGWPGWFYSFQRLFAELLLSIRLAEAKLRRTHDQSGSVVF
jgi:glycosyltransferase involved in cell wall biosynthesis